MEWGKKQVFLALIFGVGAMVFIGWLTDTPDNERKKKKQVTEIPISDNFDETLPTKPTKSQEQKDAAPAVHLLLNEADRAKKTGNLDRAISLYNQAIELLQSDPQHGPEHHYVGLTLYALALVYKSQENYAKAIESMKQSVAILEKSPQAMQPDIRYQTADALATLSDLCITVDRLDEAELPLEKSISILAENQKQLKNSNGPKEEIMRMNTDLNQMLGILYDSKSRLRLKQKRYAEAEDAGKKSLAILRKLQVSERDLMNFQIRLAEVLLLQAKFKEACDVYNTILTEREAEEGTTISLALTCKLFANNCLKYNHQSGAEDFYKKSLGILEHQRTDRRDIQEDVVDIMNCMATINKENNRLPEADKLLTKLKQIVVDHQLSPPLTVSNFFVTDRATLEDNAAEDQKKTSVFTISLRVRNVLPEGTIVVARFPPLVEGDTEEIQEQTVEKNQKEIVLKSSVHSNIDDSDDSKLYQVDITVFSDSSKKAKIGSHHTLIQKKRPQSDLL